MKVFPTSHTLFILPPSIEVLKDRLTKRGTETPEKIKTRLTNAITEISRGIEPNDATKLIGYRMINDDLDKAIPLFIRFFEALYQKELAKP